MLTPAAPAELCVPVALAAAAGVALAVPTGLVGLGVVAADAGRLPFAACRFALLVEERGTVAAVASAGWTGLVETLLALGVGLLGTATVGGALVAGLDATVPAPLVLGGVVLAMPFAPAAVLLATAETGLVELGAAAGAAVAGAVAAVDGPPAEVEPTVAAGLAEPLTEPDPTFAVLAMPFAGVAEAGALVVGVGAAGVLTGAVDTAVLTLGVIVPPGLVDGAAAGTVGLGALGWVIAAGLPLVAPRGG